MADIRYLDNLRTQELIDEIKRRLATKNPLFQYTTLPTPSAANVGETYQYIGETTLEYATYDFYKVVYDTETTTYKYAKVTYNKEEIDELIDAAGHFVVVDELPTEDIKTNVIYLVPMVQNLEVYVDSSDDSSFYVVKSDPLTIAHFDDDGELLETLTGSDAEAILANIEGDVYTKEYRDVKLGQVNNIKDEYINLDGTTAGWEKIGSTEIDLRNYVKFENLIPITQVELEDMWKDNGSVVVDKDSVSVAIGATDNVVVTSATGTISVASSDDTIATAVLSGDTITIEGVATGTATVTVTSAATASYREAETTISVTVA
jgi:hypothetical protein